MHCGFAVSLLCLLLLPWAAAQQEDDVIIETGDDTPVPPAVQPSTPAAPPAPTATPAPAPRDDTAEAEAVTEKDTGEGELPDWLLEEEAVIRSAQQRAGATTADRQYAGREPEYRYPLHNITVADLPPVMTEEADQHVVSESHLFSVSGGDSLRMGAIAARADDLFRRVSAMLKLDTSWKNSISIRLIGQVSDAPRVNPVRTRVRIIGHTPNFQIRIYSGGGVDLQKLDNAVITMVLYERALRDLSADEYPDVVSLPDWLVTGVQQALRFRTGQVDRALYRRLFDRADMMSPEEILAAEKPWALDRTSRQVYEVSCGVLMLCLMESPAGMDQLKSLIMEAASMEGTPKEMIMRHFHELGVDSTLLNKWWALELAAIAMPRASEALTPLESERRLAEALTVIYYDAETETPRPLTVDNAYALLEYPEWRKLIGTNVERLIELSGTCFPAYRPIVVEYSRVLADLLNGADADEVQNRLGPLQELRRAYVTAATRGRDYLDWYEITHLGKENSRSFDAYWEAMQLLRKETVASETPMSRYLEDVEALYKLPAGSPLPRRLLEALQPAAPEKEAGQGGDEPDAR